MSDPNPSDGSSKIQAGLFHLLSYALGHGVCDAPMPFDRRMKADMIFAFETGFRLGLEYDGAYWHQGRESQDDRKNRILIESGRVHHVMRLREEPLVPLGSTDVILPRATDGWTCAVLSLFHILHVFGHDIGETARQSVLVFLAVRAEPLPAERIRCEACHSVQEAVLAEAEFIHPMPISRPRVIGHNDKAPADPQIYQGFYVGMTGFEPATP